ncbi:serine--tRNA ligase [Tanacetum coccineum]
MLDINLFREDKGYDPEIIRISQLCRFEPVEIVDEVIHLNNVWRQRMFELEQLQKDFNKLNKDVAKLRTVRDVRAMIQDARIKKDSIKTKKEEVQAAEEARNEKLAKIRNLVNDLVPRGEDEANNVVIQTWGEKRTEPELKNHVELVQLLGNRYHNFPMPFGAYVAGNRGYYLKGAAVRLNQALINFALEFLQEKGYEALQPPIFMTKDLKLPYQVVDILSGALNDATAKKYDLEAWFPASAKN